MKRGSGVVPVNELLAGVDPDLATEATDESEEAADESEEA